MNDNKQSNVKKYLKTEGIIVSIVLPMVSLIIGVFFSNLIGASLFDTIIISLLLTITLSLIENNIKNQINAERLFEDDKKLDKKIDDLKILSTIQEGLLKTKHPYFRKWGFIKLEKFLEENQEFFEGINRTNPHMEDTFGIEGIKSTENYGVLRCLSAVPDYWDDSFSKEYLRVQEELVKTKKVRIQRIFVINKDDFYKKVSLLTNQYNVGIEVYYIFKDNQFINKLWLNEDYLIQDDKLLVEITCCSHKYAENQDSTEIITIVPSVVHKKVDRFMRILERSEKFSPDVNVQKQQFRENTTTISV